MHTVPQGALAPWGLLTEAALWLYCGQLNRQNLTALASPHQGNGGTK